MRFDREPVVWLVAVGSAGRLNVIVDSLAAMDTWRVSYLVALVALQAQELPLRTPPWVAHSPLTPWRWRIRRPSPRWCLVAWWPPSSAHLVDGPTPSARTQAHCTEVYGRVQDAAILRASMRPPPHETEGAAPEDGSRVVDLPEPLALKTWRSRLNFYSALYDFSNGGCRVNHALRLRASMA